jgi:hypothetical protein
MNAYLIVLRTAHDDLPQRLVPRLDDALRMARRLQQRDLHDPFGLLLGECDLVEGRELTIVEFAGGVPTGRTWPVARPDLVAV